MTSPDPTPERDYGERIAEVLRSQLDGYAIPPSWHFPTEGWLALADAVLAVRNEEMERLTRERDDARAAITDQSDRADDWCAREEAMSLLLRGMARRASHLRRDALGQLADDVLHENSAAAELVAMRAQAAADLEHVARTAERIAGSWRTPKRATTQAVVRAASTTSPFPPWPTRHPLRGDAASTQRHPGTLSDCIDDRCRRAVADAGGEPDWGENRAVHGDSTIPRVWTGDDPEPPVGTRLASRHGHEWVHLPGGWCLPSAHEGCPHKGGHAEWTSVRYYAPLTEIADGDTTRPS